MAKKKPGKIGPTAKTRSATARGRRIIRETAANQPTDYRQVLTDLTQLIGESRRRAAATVNRELVFLYWQIGAVIVRQQEQAKWGDAVVKQLATDLRSAFPDLKGLTRDNLFRTRQFFIACREVDDWLAGGMTHTSENPQLPPNTEIVGALPGQSGTKGPKSEKVGTLSRQLTGSFKPGDGGEKVGTLCRLFQSPELTGLVMGLSWSHHRTIIARCDTPAERYFYITLAVRERWSVRELQRQIESVLFTRYTTVKEHPERCLPDDAESGDLLPFRDHYVLEFLGLEEEHSERELRHAILANLRDFFLEFGRELSFVGEEYPLTIGNETFSIDLLFFHRRLQCLIAVDLKKGKFKPEYVGHYPAALVRPEYARARLEPGGIDRPD